MTDRSPRSEVGILRRRLRFYEFVYERILPLSPRRLPRVEVWLLAKGTEIQRRLAA